MAKWLRSWMKGNGEARESILEFLVLEGADAGDSFTLDGDAVRIGRRRAARSDDRGILLRDPTISARQALLINRDGSVVIEHDDRATNATFVNDVEIRRQTLAPGDRIRMGSVLIEVRERAGLNLSGLTEAFADERPAVTAVEDRDEAPTEGLPIPEYGGDGETQVRRVVSQLGLLVAERGAELLDEERFTLWSTGATLGRGVDCDIRVHDLGVSRKHCELVWGGDGLEVVHHSRVNATLHNGAEVRDRAAVANGDTLQLADRVRFRVELHQVDGRMGPESTTETRSRSLRSEMEAKIARDLSIEDRYRVTGSFLDVDVVNSYGMKAETTSAEHIIVSFERFRAFVQRLVEGHGGHVLNCNGDELMCFFESTVDAVRAGSTILSHLEDFNRDENLLHLPFQFRLGVHTGRSLVDLDHGVAYSAVLDTAGHLQKQADINGLVISAQTLEALPDGADFEEAGRLDKAGVTYFRMCSPFE